MTTNAGVRATIPDVVIQRGENPEKEYYDAYWENDKNREKCRGENLALAFIKEAKPAPGSTVYDFGCGTGRGGMAVALLGHCKVTLIDLSVNYLDEDVANACKNQGDNLTFLEHDLYNPVLIKAKYGYAINFLDKLNIEDFPNTIKNCLRSVDRLYFTITVTEERPFEWWVNYLRHCDVITYLSSLEEDGEATFYTSSWIDATLLLSLGKLNIEDTLVSNIKTNIKNGFTQCVPHAKQEREVILLAGGSSLNNHIEDIKQKRHEGMALVTVNGTYKWAIDKGLTPSAQVLVDGREHNKKFLSPTLPTCRYLIASQCHPSLFEGMSKDQTLIWHATVPEDLEEEVNSQFSGVWYKITGGSTVILRSIILLRMLGYYKFHIYGFDSCLMDGQHHAYEQLENEGEQLVTVSLEDKTFICTTWMAIQAQEFMIQSQIMGDEINLAVYGNGLIANILLAANREI